MADGIDIQIEGLNEVLRRLRWADDSVRRAAFRGMRAGAMDVIADAKDNLRENHSVVTGLLRASGKVQKTGDETMDVGFFDTTNQGTGYAMFTEYGRRAGRFPPIDVIAEWFKKKFRVKDEREARTAGFLIARKIAREGSAPHPFFVPAIRKNQKNIVRRMNDAINKALR